MIRIWVVLTIFRQHLFSKHSLTLSYDPTTPIFFLYFLNTDLSSHCLKLSRLVWLCDTYTLIHWDKQRRFETIFLISSVLQCTCIVFVNVLHILLSFIHRPPYLLLDRSRWWFTRFLAPTIHTYTCQISIHKVYPSLKLNTSIHHKFWHK